MKVSRRQFSQYLTLSALSGVSDYGFATATDASLQIALQNIEQKYQGRLGLTAILAKQELDSTETQVLEYRGQERFPFCSTFKVLVASAILKRHEREPQLLKEVIKITEKDLVSWAPITEEYVGKSVSISRLCAAAIQHSDNTAANLLMKKLGGLEAINQWARTLGDQAFRLDRWETELNSAIPNDERDTTTPNAMARDLYQLCLGQALNSASRQQLNDWLIHNTTGNQRIRAALPPSWRVGDKTGTGAYGSTNDIAVIWPTAAPPFILAIYFTQAEVNSKARNEVMVEASKLVLEQWKLV